MRRLLPALLPALVGSLLASVLITLPSAAVEEPPAPTTSGDSTTSLGAEQRPDAVSAMVTAQAQGTRVEDLSQRTESTQTFANPDGTWSTEMATGPVRVQHEDGSWTDIDTTLVQNAAGEWAPRATPADVSFSDGGTEPFATMAPTNDSSFGLTWPDALPAPVADGSTLTYPNAVPNGDLVVQALPGGFSHEIVLHQAPSQPVEYQIPLQLDGLSLVEQANGSLSVRTDTGKEVATAPAPLMWDQQDGPAAEPENVAPLATTVDTTGADAELVLTPDMGMLTDPATQYPVTIDPTFSQTPFRDVWVQNADFTNGQVGSPELRAGTYDGGTHKARSFVDFDTDKLVGKQILSATLKLRNFHSNSCNLARIRVRAINEGWNKDTLTWTNQPDVYNEVYDEFQPAYGADGCEANWANWNVQPIVERWADGRFLRRGFRIAAYDETNNSSWRKYRSANYTVTTSYRPHLEVTYNNHPNTPGTPSISPVAGSTTTGLVTRDATPTLSTKVSDPDGGKVRGFFEVRDSAGALEWSGQSTLVASGSTASVTVPAGELAHGVTYSVKAFADDDTGRSKKSSSTTVRVDTQAPATPTVTATSVSNGGWHDPAPTSNTFTFASTPGDATSFSYAQDDGSWITKPAGSGGDATLSWSPANGAHKLRVKAIDKAGNTSGISTFTFGVGGAELALPIDGERSTSTFDIDATAPDGAIGARLQWRLSGADAATGWNAASEVNHASTGQPWLGSITSSGGASHAEDLVWEASAETSAPAQGLLDVRVCFDYVGGLAKCSPASQVQSVPHAFGSSFPSSPLGPGQVSLFTGELEVSSTDVEVPAYTGTLSLGRSHLSYAGQPSTPAARVFGPGWAADLAGPSTGTSGYEVIDRTAEDGSITLQAPWGDAFVYQHESGNRGAQLPGKYLGVGETAAYADGLTLTALTGTASTHSLTLNETDGTTTVWERSSGGGNWRLTSVTEPQQAATTSYAYNGDGLVSWIFAPAPSGVTCTEASQQPGCRALHLNYTTVGTTTRLASVDLVIFDPKPDPTTGHATAPQTAPLSHISVAKYAYTPEGLLAASWDPRLGDGDQALKTNYTYTQSGSRTRLATITPPAEDPWTYTYDTSGRVTSVQRPQSDGAGTSIWTVDYDVPLSGVGLPDLRPAATATWGQNESDAPEAAAAVWTPDHIPAATPTAEDYEYASLWYFTAVGRTTNAATFGAGDWQIDTTWYDEHGNPTRTLTAGSRNQALADGDPVTTAENLSWLTIYSPDGSRIEDEYGPAREVVLEDGSAMVGRDHTSNLYDNETTDASLLAGQPAAAPSTGYDLVVEETRSVTDPERTLEVDAEKVRYGYAPVVAGDGNGWTLRTPTTTQTQLESGAWSAETSRYDVEGKLVELRQPGGVADIGGAGNDPKSHRIVYYTADASASDPACDNKPQWAGLECLSGPAAQPATGKALPITWTLGYDYLLNYTRVEERSGTSGTVTRTTVMTSDRAGRPTRRSLTVTPTPAGDEPVADVTYTYDTTTGSLASQTAGNDTIEYGYDSWGRQTRYTTRTGVQTSNSATTSYDAVGRVKTFDDGKGTYTYTYNGSDARGLVERRGLVTAVDVGLPSGSDTFTIAYDADGGALEMDYPNGTTARWSYNSAGDATELTYTHAGAELLGFSDTVDADGRVRTATGPASEQTYSYDNLARLTKVEDTYAGVCETRIYGFDADSNRTSLTSYQPAADDSCATATVKQRETATYDDADRITDIGYTYDELGRTRTIPAADTDQPTAGPLQVTYHANDMVAGLTQTGLPDGSGGTLTKSKTFTLDAADRLRQVTDTINGAEARRSINHYADATDSPAWTATSTDTGASWIWERNILSPLGDLGLIQSSAGESTVQLSNLHGDIVATMANDPAAADLASYSESTEYGQPRETTGSPERYGWLGAKLRSSDSIGGLVLMGVRLYNPAAGRFLQVDPVIGGSANAYDYAYQNPVNIYDLDGRQPLSHDGGGGGTLGGVSSLLGVVTKRTYRVGPGRTSTRGAPAGSPRRVRRFARETRGQIRGRDGGRGVAVWAVRYTLQHPTRIRKVLGPNNRWSFIWESRYATVVMNSRGTLITGWARTRRAYHGRPRPW